MIILKSCPFCDSTTATTNQVAGGYITYCGISTPAMMLLHKDECCVYPNVCTDVYPTIEESIKEWNYRV
jgi:hypothetical protein